MWRQMQSTLWMEKCAQIRKGRRGKGREERAEGDGGRNREETIKTGQA